MCLLDQSGVTRGGLDPYNHYNTCFICKHRQLVDGKIRKSTIVLFVIGSDAYSNTDKFMEMVSLRKRIDRFTQGISKI